MNFIEIKKYLFSLRYLILFSFLVLLAGAISGYLIAAKDIQGSQKVISQLEEAFQPFLKMGKMSQILFIFLKNSLSAFLMILGGIVFGIFPILSLISNGEILGILSYFVFQEKGVMSFFLGILPHGIIEIPCVLIAAAIGLRIGRVVIEKMLERESNLGAALNTGLSLLIKVVFPFLFLAAIIEVLVTANLFKVF